MCKFSVNPENASYGEANVPIMPEQVKHLLRFVWP